MIGNLSKSGSMEHEKKERANKIGKILRLYKENFILAGEYIPLK